MKFQFVFASFLLCSLLGELFGEVVEDTTDALLDTTDSVPERRALMYNSDCVKDPESKTIVYSRVRIPGRSTKYFVAKQRMPIQRVQVPQYPEENHINLPAYSSNNLPRGYYVKSGSTSYKYPRCGLRFQSNNDGRLGSYGRDPRCSNKVVQNYGIDGQYFGKIPQISNKKLRYQYLQYLARRALRRMMDTDNEEEEDQVEDDQDY